MKRQLLLVIIAIVWAIAVFLFCALMTSTAHARDYIEIECNGIAKAARQFAEHRDAGALEPDVLIAVNAGLEAAVGQPNSYIKDDNDKQMMRELVQLVFANPSVTPNEFLELTLQRCIKRKLKVKGAA